MVSASSSKVRSFFVFSPSVHFCSYAWVRSVIVHLAEQLRPLFMTYLSIHFRFGVSVPKHILTGPTRWASPITLDTNESFGKLFSGACTRARTVTAVNSRFARNNVRLLRELPIVSVCAQVDGFDVNLSRSSSHEFLQKYFTHRGAQENLYALQQWLSTGIF